MSYRYQADLFPNRDSIRPGTNAYVFLANEAQDDLEVVEMHWGFRPPVGERPCYNVRAEEKRFPAERRCLVPADGYSINVKDGPNKGRWFVNWPGEPDMAFAGIWRPALPDWPASYAILTCEPGPDLAPYEDRQSLFLAPTKWADWISGRTTEQELLTPLPAGTLRVQRVGRRSNYQPVGASNAKEPLFNF
jgi:putative SOS response-associated peptidase YedK